MGHESRKLKITAVKYIIKTSLQQKKKNKPTFFQDFNHQLFYMVAKTGPSSTAHKLQLL